MSNLRYSYISGDLTCNNITCDKKISTTAGTICDQITIEPEYFAKSFTWSATNEDITNGEYIISQSGISLASQLIPIIISVYLPSVSSPLYYYIFGTGFLEIYGSGSNRYIRIKNCANTSSTSGSAIGYYRVNGFDRIVLSSGSTTQSIWLKRLGI